MRHVIGVLLIVGLAGCDHADSSGGQTPTSVPVESVKKFAGREPLTGHQAEVGTVCFSPDGRFIASGGIDKAVKLWDASSCKEVRTLTGHTSGVYCVTFSPDGRFLVSGGGDALKSAKSQDFAIKVWDLVTGGEVRTLTGHSKIVSGVAFSPFGGLIASGSHDGSVRIWDITAGRQQQQVSAGAAVWSLAFSPDAKTLVVGGQGEMRFLATDGYRELARVKEHTDFVSSLAFSADGAVLASGSFDKTIRVWDPAARKSVRTLSGHTESVSAMALTRDGKVLASGGYDKAIRIWDVATGEELKKLEGHEGWVAGLAFSPDGRTLVSASGDKTVRIWSVD